MSELEMQIALAAWTLSSTMTPNPDGSLKTIHPPRLDYAVFGGQDATKFVELYGCDGALELHHGTQRVMARYSKKATNPYALPRFHAMANPLLYDALGIDQKEIERFLPGYKGGWRGFQESMEASIRPLVPTSSSGLSPGQLQGEWQGSVRLIDGTVLEFEVNVWERRGDWLANLELDRTKAFLPMVVFRGSDRADFSFGWGDEVNFKRLLVGWLSDDGNSITGQLAHHSWNDEARAIVLVRKTED